MEQEPKVMDEDEVKLLRASGYDIKRHVEQQGDLALATDSRIFALVKKPHATGNRFPDWRKVIDQLPDRTNTIRLALDAGLLYDLANAIRCEQWEHECEECGHNPKWLGVILEFDPSNVEAPIAVSPCSSSSDSSAGMICPIVLHDEGKTSPIELLRKLKESAPHEPSGSEQSE